MFSCNSDLAAAKEVGLTTTPPLLRILRTALTDYLCHSLEHVGFFGKTIGKTYLVFSRKKPKSMTPASDDMHSVFLKVSCKGHGDSLQSIYHILCLI